MRAILQRIYERTEDTGQRTVRRLVAALTVALCALFTAPGLAQSVTFGLFGRLGPDYLTPTVEAAWPLEGVTLEGRFQRDALGLGASSSLELGPLGRLTYGGRFSVGSAGWGVQARADGTVGPVALGLLAGYSNTLTSALWVGEVWDSPGPVGGFLGRASGRYRLTPQGTLGLALGLNNDLTGTARGLLEASYAFRAGPTYTFGAGVDAARFYALLGWRGELDEGGTLLEAALRAGQLNRLETALTLPLDEEALNNLKLRLKLAYPWATTFSLEAYDIRLDAAYDGGFSVGLRYTLRFGGEE